MTETDTDPDWWRFWLRFLMAVSAAAAVVASYVYLVDLAVACGWTAWRAPLLPTSLDVLGIAALAIYVRKRDRYAQAVSIAVVAASATGNALSHLYSVSGIPPSSAVVVAVGSTPVVVAIVLAHLWAHERKRAGTWVPKSPSEPVELAAAAGPVSAPSGDGSRTASSSGTRRNGTRTAPVASGSASRAGSRSKQRTDSDLVALTVAEQWSTLSGDQLAEKLHVAKGRALRIRNLAQSSSPTPPTQPLSPHPAAATNGGVHAGTG